MDEATKRLSPNFGFLAQHDELLVEYAARAERYVFDDPNSALIKLRQFAECLAKRAAAYAGEYSGPEVPFTDILNRLRDRGILDGRVADLFHGLRKAGNVAAHEGAGSQREALSQLRMARNLAIWFHRAFSTDNAFKPGPFVPPPEPRNAENALRQELEELRQELSRNREAADAEIGKAYRDLETALKLAQESEQRLVDAERQLEEGLRATQERASARSSDSVQFMVERAQEATATLDLSESDTRKLIDKQLQLMGWRADTQQYTYANGTRPQRGVNLAIAEWPTASGPADYVLFCGLRPLAVVEAKRKNRDVAGAIGQAKRYSHDYAAMGDESLPGGPWDEYKIPFLFSTNGRPYLKQIETKSGIWFQDVRRSTNHPRALKNWYTPQGLLDALDQDHAAAEQKLDAEPLDYLPLRDYQRVAIEAVERAISQEQRAILVAMATGTGKTRTCIGLVYRLIKTKRFKRILFLVDRSALGEQAANAFKDVRLENLKTFTDIYDLRELEDQHPDQDTRLHISTVQGMIRRLLYQHDDEDPIPVDRYDCIVIDECHRGYTLDSEMSDTELTFRSEEEYVSKYRAAVEYFDAVKIGLTATPALHTTEIFGRPIFEYSYRQAVIDGWLIDHEPPIRIITKLAEDGITWLAGDEMMVFDPRTQQLDMFNVPDEVDVDIEEFNRRVITENFNKAVCGELARHIDPTLEGKTLVFCATDTHADMVVDLLKKAFDAQYGGVDDDAVQKITAAADKPRKLIRKFKNERLPSVAVTVDLLTTGIDVPEIVNLVFIRRVKSRILYEQMLGRGTRLCDDIGKQFFRVFDCVELYTALQDVTSMKPVVAKPDISFSQLVEELGRTLNREAMTEVLDQLTAKLQRKKRQLKSAALDEFVALTGMQPADFIHAVRTWPPARVFNWFDEHRAVVAFLDAARTGDGRPLIISDHEDEIRRVERGYGTSAKPDDYLESFNNFVRDNINQIPALVVVTRRPRELTRAQLKELRLLLDQKGYSESNLRTAWREKTNQDIAASIIGHIRRAALGAPLVPYEERIDRAIQAILNSRNWTDPQRKWLDRIAKQLREETIVDREALDRGQFKTQGGFDRLNRVFDGKMEIILQDINEEIWHDIA